MKNFIFILSFTITLFITSQAQAAKDSWVKINEENGIEVYELQKPSSSLISFKGSGIIYSPIGKVLNVLLDGERAPEWAADLEQSKVLSWISRPKVFIEYNHINMPFILSDRDFISQVNIQVNKKNKSIIVRYSTPKNSKYQKVLKDGHVLGDLNGSYFKLTSINNGQSTLLEGVVRCNPKGMLPTWVVNLFQKDWALTTINAIRTQSAKSDVTVHARFKKLLERNF
jgi:hypothetical protein